MKDELFQGGFKMAIKCTVIISEDRCIGCGLCVRACPRKILVIDVLRTNKQGQHIASVTETEQCIGCGSCNMICPEGAVSLIKE